MIERILLNNFYYKVEIEFAVNHKIVYSILSNNKFETFF